MNEQQKEILKNSNFKCEKCGFYSPFSKDWFVIEGKVLCGVCGIFAPKKQEELKEYLSEKLDWRQLESFRRFKRENNLKEGMIKSAKKGKIVSRPAFGYRIDKGILMPAENSDEVREIFQEFLSNLSLSQISKNHNLSVNGIKKILKNFTYIGKVKFDNQILNGNHPAIISQELFNSVQQRFEKLKKI